MAQFNDWCLSVDEPIGNHFRRVMTGQAANLAAGVQATAAIVPGHYASEEQMARAFARLGKLEAAALIQGKLPTTKAIRSGDLGEIYATEWIDAHSGGYQAPIKRLRWKDHRNLAMRGDDVIGILQDAQTQRLQFLKTEAKSRAALTGQVLTEARAGLDKDGGLFVEKGPVLRRAAPAANGIGVSAPALAGIAGPDKSRAGDRLLRTKPLPRTSRRPNASRVLGGRAGLMLGAPDSDRPLSAQCALMAVKRGWG